MTKASGRQTTYRRYKQEHRCGRCGTQLPEWYAHTYCQKCLEIKRQDNRWRRQALREKNGKPCRKPVLSPEEIKEARELYAWLKSLRDSETCRQSVSSGRHINVQMRYLKAAWEAYKRERGTVMDGDVVDHPALKLVGGGKA